MSLPTMLSIPPWFDCGLSSAGRAWACETFFQSHLGSIAARGTQVCPSLLFPLSIPPWFDCGHPLDGRTGAVKKLSIPPWFDCGRRKKRLASPSKPLSIPPWFDCGSQSSYEAQGRCLTFQSHLGSIAADDVESLLSPDVALSIPPWFDCGAFPKDASRQGFCLSIPPWFDCGRARKAECGQGTTLSIPPWFDCGVQAALAYLRHRYTFNPTLVRLRRVHPGWRGWVS